MPPDSPFAFLNVPFDRQYRKLMRALVFGIHDCGLVARCALETDDGGDVRINKLYDIIEQCRYGIHDLSRTTLDSKHNLPRFNMPVELGILLGGRKYGDAAQRKKSLLILDRDQYRFQVFCSDIAGQDVRAHHNDAVVALTVIRNWLQSGLPRTSRLPGPGELVARYLSFQRHLPLICKLEHMTASALTFLDLQRIIDAWIEDTPSSSSVVSSLR